MATTNFTITGTDFLIKTQFGEYFQDGGLAIVQWDLGYDPRYRPLQEWTSNYLTQVSWTAWYQRDFNSTGHSLFGSNGTLIDTKGPLYLFVDFGNSSNYTNTMAGQAWLGQITDVLSLTGGDQVIDLNTANIRPVVGDVVGNTLIARDFSTWTPQAVPEPSYSYIAGFIFLGVVLYKKYV
jgi:hypothetical protein